MKVSFQTDAGSAAVLDDVGLTLQRGQVVGVVGESGCGKSTLIRAIMGTLPRSAQIEAGTIVFEGENLLAFSENELNSQIRGGRIGFIPQDPLLSLNPVFKVGSQMLEIMRDHALRGTRRRDHVQRLVGLLRRLQVPDPESALERYPHQFSGGQRQRLLIAAALACSPGLVIADEPTTALDVTTQHEILLLLRELVDELSISLLFVTHDLGVVAELCDTICVIYAGQTIEFGPVDKVLNRPSHPYTRTLLACHPERATLFRRHTRRRAVAIADAVRLPLCPTVQPCRASLCGCLAGCGNSIIGRRGALCASGMSDPIVELRHISVLLGGSRGWFRRNAPPVKAVDDVSLSISGGEVLALVGESGSGKTTLGRTVLGLQRETSGAILLDGRPVSGLAADRARKVRSDVQYVHQDAAASLDPWWSIGATLREGLLVNGVRSASERAEKVDSILQSVGLEPDAGRRYPHEFSGGQLRRVSLARILLLRPRLLILDEPTSGLDMSVQATVLNLLLDLRGSLGLTYLFISHDLSVVKRLSDRVAIMYRGKIVECAATSEVFCSADPSLYAILTGCGPASGQTIGTTAGIWSGRAKRYAYGSDRIARLATAPAAGRLPPGALD